MGFSAGADADRQAAPQVGFQPRAAPQIGFMTQAEAHVGFTTEVADEVVRVRFEDLDGNAVHRTKHAVMDWLGVTIAGAAEQSATIARGVMLTEGGVQSCSVLGTPVRATASQAALLNGIAGHALDFDDLGLGAHPSVPVISAVFALAEELASDGKRILAAIVAGYQAMSWVSTAAGSSSYLRGFHTTGTLGTLGAAAGCGHLLGFSRVQLEQALGLAATQAAGLKASFATMAKHLNAGKAAANGLQAARLAEAGFTGPHDVLESEQGFIVSHNADGERLDPARARGILTGRLAVEFIYFKAHASCGASHSAIEGIRSALREHPFAVDDVERVQLTVPSASLDICGIDEPDTGLEGKFSLKYVASLAVTGRDTGPSAFTDVAVRQQFLREVRSRIDVVPYPSTKPSDVTTVTIQLRDGTSLSASVNPNLPVEDARLDEQDRLLTAKFFGLVEPVVGPNNAGLLHAQVAGFEALKSPRQLGELAHPS